MSREDAEARDTLFMLGGVAMVIFGAGLILSNPIVRKFMGQAGVGGLNLLTAAVPDFERYLKLRNM
ncbi:MAG TPA: hypothetical protein VMR62_12810 [Bryobacteraceae bacterium]|jgi:hypothetical protein|nr:hypothetical protein [Bryobacteraceae bacterium]